MKTVMTVLGARPQFIKAATVSRIIGETSELGEVLVHTGQHFDANMSDVFFEELDTQTMLPLRCVGRHSRLHDRALERLETVMQQERPDCIMVYGDTNSTLAGALSKLLQESMDAGKIQQASDVIYDAAFSTVAKPRPIAGYCAIMCWSAVPLLSQHTLAACKRRPISMAFPASPYAMGRSGRNWWNWAGTVGSRQDLRILPVG